MMEKPERWPGYESYAYLTICDGPDDVEDEFAPSEPPTPGDPLIYTLDPEALSTSSGVTATRVGRRGDRRRNRRYETRNFWELRSSLNEECAPHEHVRNILDQLSPGWAVFLTACERYFAIMRVVIKGPNPGLVIDARDMARIAALHASLDVDAYGAPGADE